MMTESIIYKKDWVDLVSVLNKTEQEELDDDQFDGFDFDKYQLDKKEALISKIASEFKVNDDILLSQILEITQNIDFAIPKEIHENLDELFFCFLNGKSKATISIIGLLCERFCVCLFEKNIPSQISCSKQRKKRSEAFSTINQVERINYLYAIGVIDDSTAGMLDEIRNKRNNAIHPSSNQNYEKDAINCVNLMIIIFNKHKFLTNEDDNNDITN